MTVKSNDGKSHRLEGQGLRRALRAAICMRIAGSQAFLISIGILVLSATCLGDSIRPAYLEIIETSPGSLDIVWKLPNVQDLPPGLTPELPDSYTPMSGIEEIKTPDAAVKKWSLIGKPLSGQTIGIQALETFTMEALVRIELHDGTTIRTVLKPNAPALTLPTLGTHEEGTSDTIWIYAGLFALAFSLSLTRPARERGVILCSIALITGSLAGHILGNRIPRKTPLSEKETKRILEGLMLNTYRAFIFDDDEEVYDILSRSVEGNALNDIFLQNRSRLSFNDEESASSLVDRLDIKSIESVKQNPDGSMTLLTDWDVYGQVFHWEHIHFRCNAFKAEITIMPSDNYWKILGLHILEEERVL